MKRRQNARKLEIIAVVAVVAVAVVVGVYLALNAQNPRDALVGTTVSRKVYSLLYQASQASYGASGSAYLKDVQNVTGPLYTMKGKPILVSATGEHCAPCALQRWPLIMALMRFGNFTNLEYMTSAAYEGDYSTFAFAASRYNSSYLVFQPYEVYDRAGVAFQTLPANYSSADQQYGKSTIPFLDFAGKYVISGGILSNPGLLGTKNWTQIISSIQAGDSLGGQIKQAANLITAMICETTGNKPALVCSQNSITDTLVSYIPPSASSGSELLLNDASFTMSPGTLISGRDYSGWN
jgi:hypothetical protein